MPCCPDLACEWPGTLSSCFGELDTYTARHGGADLYAFDTSRDNDGRIATMSETVEGVTHAWEYLREKGLPMSVARSFHHS